MPSRRATKKEIEENKAGQRVRHAAGRAARRGGRPTGREGLPPAPARPKERLRRSHKKIAAVNKTRRR